ncbi:unnamed protein product [Rhizopus microsporus]
MTDFFPFVYLLIPQNEVTNQQLEARDGKDEVITLAQDAKSGLTGALGSESMSIDKVLSHLRNQ